MPWIIWVLLIGAVSGWLAGVLFKGYGFGLLGNIVVGIVGGFIGHWLLPQVGLKLDNDILGSIVTAVIGAIILLALISLVKRAT